MKKITILILFLFIESAGTQIIGKSIQKGDRISYADDIWKKNGSSKNYFIKDISHGTGSYSEFYTATGEFAFSTDCQYEFIHKGRLIGYSNPELKFYSFSLKDNKLIKVELNENEVQELFPNFKIIKISSFDSISRSLNIKKGAGRLKILLLNDTNEYFYHYTFNTQHSKKYPLAGLLDIKAVETIPFSHIGGNSKLFPSYTLVVK